MLTSVMLPFNGIPPATLTLLLLVMAETTTALTTKGQNDFACGCECQCLHENCSCSCRCWGKELSCTSSNNLPNQTNLTGMKPIEESPTTSDENSSKAEVTSTAFSKHTATFIHSEDGTENLVPTLEPMDKTTATAAQSSSLAKPTTFFMKRTIPSDKDDESTIATLERLFKPNHKIESNVSEPTFSHAEEVVTSLSDDVPTLEPEKTNVPAVPSHPLVTSAQETVDNATKPALPHLPSNINGDATPFDII